MPATPVPLRLFLPDMPEPLRLRILVDSGTAGALSAYARPSYAIYCPRHFGLLEN